MGTAEIYRAAAAADVLDRLPDARHASARPRTSSRRRSCATTARAAGGRRRRIELAEGLPVRRDHPAVHRPAAFGAGPARGIRGRVAARAAADRRGGAGPGRRLAEQADSLSMAFLLLLERLTPVERAVFLLHDVFGYDYDEIAGIVGKSEDNCRQLALRARRHVDEGRPRFEASRGKRDELAAPVLPRRRRRRHGRPGRDARRGRRRLRRQRRDQPVVAAPHHRARPRKPPAARHRRADPAARRSRSSPAEINGQPGAMFLDPDGSLTNVFVLDIADGQVQTVRSVINPDKLRHLGPLADIPRLRRRLRSS